MHAIEVRCTVLGAIDPTQINTRSVHLTSLCMRQQYSSMVHAQEVGCTVLGFICVVNEAQDTTSHFMVHRRYLEMTKHSLGDFNKAWRAHLETALPDSF